MAGNKQKINLYPILVIIFALTIGAVIFIVQIQKNDIIADLSLNRAKTANQSLVNYLVELEERVIVRADVVAGDDSVLAAVKNRDHASLRRELNNYVQGLDYISISDENGIVLARSHNDSTGDDITRFAGIRKVLQTGRPALTLGGIDTLNSRLTIYASDPIYDGDILVGLVSCFYDLERSEYVNSFKERTGCEATVFLKDECISSTLVDESGGSIVGTRAHDFIVRTVLEERNEYLGNLELYGKVYGVCYTPLIFDNEVIGMLFAGVDIQPTITAQRNMNIWIIFAGIIGFIISVILFIISNIVTRKYAKLAERQLNQQKLMADISRSFLADINNDTLITKTLQMVGEFMNISQILFFRLKDDGVTLICRNEWINPKLGFNTRIGSCLPLREPILSIIENLTAGSGKDACLSSDDPVIRKAMLPYRANFKNYITTPVYIKGEMIGVIDFSRTESDHEWSASEISLATLFANTMSSVFEREAMVRRTSIVENSPIMIFYSDVEGNLAYANPAAATITGYTIAELYEGGFGLIVDLDDVYSEIKYHNQQALDKGMVKHEINLKCKDGQKRILSVTIFRLEDNMLAAICIDLTEIRELEAALTIAKENAEQASSAKSDFLSNMSHEMRTPMNAIIGMTTIAKRTADSERRMYALNKVEESSKHLLGIINDILDMSKIEANKLELSEVHIELRSLLQKAVSFERIHIDEKQLKLSMNVEENVPYFFIGDDQRLTQVLTNLLSNAAKFTPEDGEIVINVSQVGSDDDTCELRFEVSDSGIGISPEQQKKIFNVFEQAESGTTRKFGGTGLGLAISKRIIELMGGQISIDSELGKGSKFIFTVKLNSVSDDTHLRRLFDNTEDVFANLNNEFSGKKMLLAEDIEINREILMSLLEGTGLIIDTAENGRQALDKVTASPGKYDIIFMDMQMPEMDGLEASRHIREFEAKPENINNHRQIPIIAMTANVFKEDIDNCLAAGMNDHIGKPIELNIVFEKLKKFLQ